MNKTRFLLVTLLLALLVVSPLMAQDDEPIEFSAWFFGVCDEYEGITDMEDTSNFAGEGPIICIMLNAYNEENPDNPVEPVITDWPGTTELNTRLAGGDPNDVAVLHGVRVPAYASRGLLTPIGPLLEEYGIDPDGWVRFGSWHP